MRTRILAFALMFGGAFAHASTIYRCSDAAGGVLYADAPCTGGRIVDIPRTRIDPLARERLQRDLEAFDKRQAARDAERARREREAQSLRAEAAATTPVPEMPPEPTYLYGGLPYAFTPAPPPRPRPLRRPPRPSESYIRLR